MQNAECIKRVKRIGSTYDKGNQVVIVVSAMGDTTDNLIDLAKQVAKNPPKEKWTCFYPQENSNQWHYLPLALMIWATDLFPYRSTSGILTDPVHSKSKILSIDSTRLEEELSLNR